MIALTSTSIAWLLFAVILGGWVVYAFLNIRQSRDELGSEIELAANRKKYYDDEELEGPRLTRVLGIGVILLVIMVIGLPLYWILEPARQAGAEEAKDEIFVEWGSQLFATTADGGFNCAGCHGGMNGAGGEAPYNLTDPATGEVRAVNWKAPAVNTIFYRFDEDEVRFILVYGRPFSPMSPWGLEGGGPMNSQQIDTLIAYMKSIQVERENCGVGEDDPKTCPSGNLPADTQSDIDTLALQSVEDGTYASYGEALYNLELASGAYSCARCHTQGWSWGDPGQPGQGAFGWNLTGGAVNAHFPNEAEMVDFIRNGSVFGQKYGIQGQGSGRMPGFGAMLTDEQIQAIVEYVRTL
ncbi:MAG: c-type cytochrome [Ilumatobacter sp.]|uniref:c-type cytochrome n=1 Tax=Ilumatobacter sp. TaxID=1967498 RepID=UPI00260CFD73|nr:c-type cytochrome [Ilumatobacter sp.]MDJ0768524.1 c-type cytochrome [Ilumatobacter sp.]